ncbi:MAG: hypothetical protein AAF184_20360 [Pseudomonadota bacterium]
MTFLLELAGLSLAFIEVRVPGTAAQTATYLGRLAAPIEDLRRRHEKGADAEQRLSNSLGKLLRVVLNLGTLPILIVFATNAWQAFTADAVSIAWLIPELISLVVLLVVVTLGLLLLCLVLYLLSSVDQISRPALSKEEPLAPWAFC